EHVSGKNNAFADALSRVGHTYVTKEWPAEKVKAEKELIKKLFEREAQRRIAAMTIANLGHAPELKKSDSERDYDTVKGTEIVLECSGKEYQDHIKWGKKDTK
ncbi:hypothetical protein ADUPG1_005626, partial [Aduncisulcus paluster]